MTFLKHWWSSWQWLHGAKESKSDCENLQREMNRNSKGVFRYLRNCFMKSSRKQTLSMVRCLKQLSLDNRGTILVTHFSMSVVVLLLKIRSSMISWRLLILQMQSTKFARVERLHTIFSPNFLMNSGYNFFKTFLTQYTDNAPIFSSHSTAAGNPFSSLPSATIVFGIHPGVTEVQWQPSNATSVCI